ncbi:hypothetical protein OSTOST_25778 [Ostertagia ostertagi]
MGQLCMWDLTDGLPAVNMNVTTKIAECCVRQICFGANGRLIVAVADDYSVTRLERILEGEEIPSYCNTAGILNGPTAKKAKRRGRRLGKKRNDSDSGSSEDSDMRTN